MSLSADARKGLFDGFRPMLGKGFSANARKGPMLWGRGQILEEACLIRPLRGPEGPYKALKEP